MIITQEEFRNRVAQLAREQLQHYSWFNGVCMDGIMDRYPNLIEAVDHAVFETVYYDANKV
jgi:hypothetical protein